MNIQRKLEITQQAIASISEHRDEDSRVRLAALLKVKEQADAAVAAVEAETAEKIARAVGE